MITEQRDVLSGLGRLPDDVGRTKFHDPADFTGPSDARTPGEWQISALLFTDHGMSPPRAAQPPDDRALRATARFALEFGGLIREERRKRRLTLRQLAARAGVSASEVHRVESGTVASVHSYIRLTSALGLSPRIALDDPRRSGVVLRAEDPVHAAMGEVEASRLATFGHAILIDEPFQHYQFAGRGDVVAINRDTRALLHIENRTRFPNVQEAFGSYNTKRAYLAQAIAERLNVPGGFLSVTHAVVALWSSEVLHVIRLRQATFRAACPDPFDAFDRWWSGQPPERGTRSTLVLMDPIDRPRSRRFIGLDAALKAEPRYRGYGEAADALRRAGQA